MKNYLLNGALIFGAAIFLISCSKDDKNTGGQVSYKVKPANFTATIASSGGGSAKLASTASVTVQAAGNLTWTSGIINISEIDFEAENDSREIEYEMKQMVNVDLFKLSPVLGNVVIPPGTYNEVELKLELDESTTSDIPLTLKGTYTDANGAATPVEFYFNEYIEIGVEAENVVIGSQDDYTGMINFQLNKLLTNITAADLADAAKTDGKILINKTTNVALYNKVKLNFDVFGTCEFEK
jgi:hypothetical protein